MMARVTIRLLFALLLIAATGMIGGYLYLRRSLPEFDGTIAVTGISADVEIVRDAHAIPHIFASTRLDALFALGYVHAQDRLWQMEFQRRIAHGRLSEIFGAVTIPQDRFLRTVGFGRAARSAWEHLPSEGREALDAYTSGINAFISSHQGSRLPPEFSLLRFEPEPWTGADVIGWGKMMAWDLSANYALELLRHDIGTRVGPGRLQELMPPYPADGPSIVMGPLVPRPAPPDGRTGSRKTGAAASWLAAFGDSLKPFGLSGGRAEGLGSNNWVVDGSRTASGKPLLANDPHLAPHIPSLWYLAHMKAGEFEVIGATLPGAPAVIIGRNRHIAWGLTNVAADVQDLYIERLDSSGRHAEFRGVPEPLRVGTEIIRVKGQDPIRVEVRSSRHGPLVSDAININNAEADTDPKPEPLPPLAFRWTALDTEDRSVMAFFRLNEARNWTDFTAALREFVVPSQNFIYADTAGHIGYYAPGRIPIRASGDGSRPSEGWTGQAEWTGWIPFEQLPHVFDPPEHFIVTANHQPMPNSYPYLISLEYPEPYRAQRITELLLRDSRLTADRFREIQADTVSLHARTLVPVLLQHARATDAADARALDLIRHWDFDMGGHSAAAAVFQAWFLRLAPMLAEDELGEILIKPYQERFSLVTRFVIAALGQPAGIWCDETTTSERESCSRVVSAALHEAVQSLTERIGSDLARWRWDDVHRARFPHQGLDSVPLLGWLLNRTVPNGGDFATVNVGPVSPERPFEQREVPSYRQIIDLSPANDSRFLDPTGQSGHFLSPYYDEALTDWQRVQHRPMRMERDAIERGARGHLRLVPHVSHTSPTGEGQNRVIGVPALQSGQSAAR